MHMGPETLEWLARTCACVHIQVVAQSQTTEEDGDADPWDLSSPGSGLVSGEADGVLYRAGGIRDHHQRICVTGSK